MKFSVRKKGKLKLQAKDVILKGSLSSSKSSLHPKYETNVTTKVE